jgi:hypothetical protein
MSEITAKVGANLDSLVQELDLIANNVANASTVGFKRRTNSFSKVLEAQQKAGMPSPEEYKVDGASDEERQQYVFDKVISILDTEFDFDDKDKVRRYFLELRQIFIDWNYAAMGSEQFKKLEAAIDAKVKEHSNA